LFQREFQVIWANLDPNAHMRHSAYNDYAAQVRVSLFNDLGFSLNELVAAGFGIVLMHEDTSFYKEVLMSERITVTCQALTYRSDMKIWKFRHQILKENGEVSCVIIATGAFMDLKTRKVIVPPIAITSLLDKIPKTDDFYIFEK
jgi:acyl-CoA thioester hydrolase